jgi:hypothetical protein
LELFLEIKRNVYFQIDVRNKVIETGKRTVIAEICSLDKLQGRNDWIEIK